ncbi:MAG: response regulator transcription factor [Nitrospirota bacterium]
MRVLLVEDEPDLAAITRDGLQEEGYSVDVCADGEDALYMAREVPYDAVILDVMLPSLDGFGVLKSLRKEGKATPVLLLTARGAIEDKVRGLDTGADDYLTKPFEFRELLARLRTIMRRHTPDRRVLLEAGPVRIDPATRAVRVGGKLVELTAKEFALLEFLVRRHDRAVTRTEIIEHIYDDSFDSDSNVIDVHVNALRKKLGRRSSTTLIQTVRGVGYMLRTGRA